jgi:hypothetical protein
MARTRWLIVHKAKDGRKQWHLAAPLDLEGKPIVGAALWFDKDGEPRDGGGMSLAGPWRL